MVVDPEGEVAPYLQLATILREQIESGELGPGSRIPSVVKLAEQYRVARVTAHKAMRLLVAEGLLVVSPGRGMFVSRHKLAILFGLADRLRCDVVTDAGN